MVWAKLDDGILDSPKVAAVGALGFAVHVAGIVYGCRNLTDGFVPFSVAKRLLDFDGVMLAECSDDAQGDAQSMLVASFDDTSVLDLIRRGAPGHQSLEDAGLWTWDDERRGWWITNFLDWNPSRAEAEAARAERTEKAQKAAKARWHAQRDAPSMRRASPKHEHVDAQAMPRPVPDPYQEEKTIAPTTSTRETEPAVEELIHGPAMTRPRATPTVPSRDVVPVIAKPKPRKRDEVWDALLEACGIDGTNLTASARGAYNRAVRDLKAAGATADEVRRRADCYRRAWPDVSLTPTALARRWSEVGTGPSDPAVDVVRRLRALEGRAG